MSGTSIANLPKRRYHAPLRARQAEMTRARILAAARTLFAERSYVGTTLEAVAREAQVSLPTVYGTFGSKRVLLETLIESLKAEHDLTPRVIAVARERDPVRQIALAVDVICDFDGQIWDVLDVLRGAALVESEVAPKLEEFERERIEGQYQIALDWDHRELLREGLTARAAADLFWLYGSWDLYRRLVIERGWDVARYKAWLRESLSHQLFRATSP